MTISAQRHTNLRNKIPDATPRQLCPVLLILLMRPKQGRNTLRALTAEGKQRETQVPGHLLPVVGKALRWGKSGVSRPCRPPASPPDHPSQPRIVDCTLYIGLLLAKKTTMRESQIFFSYLEGGCAAERL